METERLSMRKIREILRLKWAVGRSHREVAASLGISVGAVSVAEQRAREAGYGTTVAQHRRPLPDPIWIHTERKKPGVTLELLHHEYLKQHPGGYAYSQFCEHYRRWCQDRRLSMRQVHRAGEKLFVDFAGQKPDDSRSRDRRGARVRAVRRGARRLQLHLRRGHRHSADRRL